ncbi:MAG: PmoA family protein, partial [Rubrivivax sp.]|nr:PmoA family protein [Pyrinomonadaceae bacterium]
SASRPGARGAAGAAQLTRESNRLDIKVAGRRVLSFQAQPGALPDAAVKPVFLRGGYIHPVYTPSGRVVTDDYPSDHYHHHGIWFAWTKTAFEGRHPDFWNVADGTGRVEFEAVEGTWSGPVHAGFKSRQRYVDLTGGTPKTALKETWEVTAYGGSQGPTKYFVFDLVATQECATASPVVLEEYRYGGMGVRGHRDWKDKSKVSFLTSEGKDRGNGNATRARWCHIGGPVEGQPVGIAILDHPANFRAPQPMRLNPDDPFFNYAPSQLGPFEIKPGSPYVARYRYVISDGPPDAARLDRLWNDYADPPRANVIFK